MGDSDVPASAYEPPKYFVPVNARLGPVDETGAALPHPWTYQVVSAGTLANGELNLFVRAVPVRAAAPPPAPTAPVAPVAPPTTDRSGEILDLLRGIAGRVSALENRPTAPPSGSMSSATSGDGESSSSTPSG